MSQKAPFGGNSRAIGDKWQRTGSPGMGIKVPQDFCRGSRGRRGESRVPLRAWNPGTRVRVSVKGHTPAVEPVDTEKRIPFRNHMNDVGKRPKSAPLVPRRSLARVMDACVFRPRQPPRSLHHRSPAPLPFVGIILSRQHAGHLGHRRPPSCQCQHQKRQMIGR